MCTPPNITNPHQAEARWVGTLKEDRKSVKKGRWDSSTKRSYFSLQNRD